MYLAVLIFHVAVLSNFVPLSSASIWDKHLYFTPSFSLTVPPASAPTFLGAPTVCPSFPSGQPLANADICYLGICFPTLQLSPMDCFLIAAVEKELYRQLSGLEQYQFITLYF